MTMAMKARDGFPIGITTDIKSGAIWLYTSDKIFEISKNNEDRDIWKLYLERAMESPNPNSTNSYFKTALSLCKVRCHLSRLCLSMIRSFTVTNATL